MIKIAEDQSSNNSKMNECSQAQEQISNKNKAVLFSICLMRI
jgi:hypothetical protein